MDVRATWLHTSGTHGFDFESGFVTIHNAETLSKPRSITFDEGVALVLGLDLLRSAISPERRDLLERIDLLSQRLAGLIKLPSALSATSVVNQEVSGAITDALKSRKGLEISYHSLYRDEISTRTILPIEIVESEGQLYLSSYCYTASDFREFRIDRIQRAAVQVVLQEIPKSSLHQSRYTCTIKVLTPTRAVAERFKQSELEVNTAFDFETYSFQWIERSIMASGRAVCLQSPPDVRKSIAVMAQTMLDRYKAR
ncbi:hypothetical protein EMGBS11_03550 [Actinomycetota bacterium]|nr:hypothetical protein EMGBS11_03550 [Actinomycetota bacterium]